MKVLDLCSGKGGFSQAFLERGHQVIRIDYDKKFKDVPNTIILDIRKIEMVLYYGQDSHVVLISPDCAVFSMGSQRHHWQKQGEQYLPKTQKAIDDLTIIYTGLHIIQKIQPRFWILENPKATLHKFIGEAIDWVTYCQYEKHKPIKERRQKPTGLWGELPKSFEFKNCKRGSSCHPPTPRGAKMGTQALSKSEDRALIPYKLSEALCIAIEKEIKNEEEDRRVRIGHEDRRLSGKTSSERPEEEVSFGKTWIQVRV